MISTPGGDACRRCVRTITRSIWLGYGISNRALLVHQLVTGRTPDGLDQHRSRSALHAPGLSLPAAKWSMAGGAGGRALRRDGHMLRRPAPLVRMSWMREALQGALWRWALPVPALPRTSLRLTVRNGRGSSARPRAEAQDAARGLRQPALAIPVPAEAHAASHLSQAHRLWMPTC